MLPKDRSFHYLNAFFIVELGLASSLRQVYSSGSQLLPELCDLLGMTLELSLLESHLICWLVLEFLVAKLRVEEQSPDLHVPLHCVWTVRVETLEVS